MPQQIDEIKHKIDNTTPKAETHLAVLAVLCAILVGVAYYQHWLDNRGVVKSAATVRAQNQLDNSLSNGILNSASWSDTTLKPKLKQPAPELPAISAKAYLAYDIDSGKILTGQNADAALPVASLTKLATALLVSRNASPDKVVEVRQYMIENLPGPNLGLVDGEKITVGSLVEGMLVASANDAAEVLAYAIADGNRERAITMMNNLAQNLKLSRTRYANPTGFDDPGGYSSALDVLTLVLELRRIPWLMSILSETTGEVWSADRQLVHRFNSTNLLLKTDGDLILAGKTGFTDEARGNLVVFAKSPVGSGIVVVLLGSENREEEMRKLLSWLHSAFEW